MSNKTKIVLVIALIILLVLIIRSCSTSKKEVVLSSSSSDHLPEVSSNSFDHLQEVSSDPFNYLPDVSSGEIIYHSYYTLAYSEESEQASWVAYKITTDNFNSSIKRKDAFRVDPQVSTVSAELSDYRKSGYDRGHLAPAGSMKINAISMSESFFMSNMSPQLAGFNRGVWKKLEGEVRSITSNSDSVFVVTGPILDDPIEFIGKNKVAVPKAYFKTLVSYRNGIPSGIAFVLPHEKSSASVYSFSTSIDKVEEITGIDFYVNLQNQSDFESTDRLNGY